MDTVIIVNPEAGGLTDLAELEQDLGPLSGAELLVTEQAGEGRSLAEYAATSGVGQIVAAGGDGTVNEIVHGIVASGVEVRLGVLPVGTANDYARSLGIPLEVEEAARLIAGTGTASRLDLVELTGAGEDLFVNLAIGGFCGSDGESVDPEVKSRWGSLAYVLEAADQLPDLQTYRIQLHCDEGSPEEVEVVSLVLANGSSTGGGIRIAPDARLDDGQVDVITIPALGLTELAGLVPQILTGSYLEDDRVMVRRAERVRLETDPPMPFRADGQESGRGGMELRVRPGALAVVTGPAS
jgi:diacylglycerol kinase (ATP)